MSTALSCGVLIEFGNLSLGHLPELVGGSSVGTTCSLRLPLPPVSSALSSSLCSLQDWRFFARVWAGGWGGVVQEPANLDLRDLSVC